MQSDKDSDTRKKASQALYNLVNSQPDEKIRKREIRIMKLLEDSRKYIECLKYNLIYELEKSATATSEQSEEGNPNIQLSLKYVCIMYFYYFSSCHSVLYWILKLLNSVKRFFCKF